MNPAEPKKEKNMGGERNDSPTESNCFQRSSKGGRLCGETKTLGLLNLCRCRRCEWGRNLLLQSPFRGSRNSCNPCSYLNERQLGVDTFVSVASKARGRSHQKTKIINFVGCFQTKQCMHSLSPCRDLAMPCGCPAEQYARICDRRLGAVSSRCPRTVALCKELKKRKQRNEENEEKETK